MSEDIRHFEDLAEGEVWDYGPRTVTREEIIDFARQFDPQPFHLDEGFAKKTLLGGLSASGWHTCSLWMAMFCEAVALRIASLGAPGVEEIRWLKPVMAGDTLTGRTTLGAPRVSSKRPWMGFVPMTHECFNQRGEAVIQMTSTQMLRRRGMTESAP